MNTGNIRNLLVLCILMLLTSMLACSAGGRDVYEVGTLAVDSFKNKIFPDDKPVLKKKILIAPIINKAELSDSQAEEVSRDCIKYLSEDKDLLITKLNNSDQESILKQYGVVINPLYVKTAEKEGMDIILTCVIHPMEITEKRTGIWPRRKDNHNVLITISMNALDTLNGTFIVYKDITGNINFEKNAEEKNDNWTPDYDMIKPEIPSITKELCDSVIEKLKRQPWQSKVIADGNNLVINAGETIGINNNTVFEVFKKGDLVQAYAKGEYNIFGDKIGEVRAKAVSKDKTVLAANGDIKDAAFVRVKRSDD